MPSLLRIAALLLLGLGLGSCQQVLGVEDVSVRDAAVEPDAESSSIPRLVAGAISGLSPGDFVELSLNSGAPHAVSQNGSFVFPGFMTDNETYEVLVVSPPTHLNCLVDNGSGTIGGANVMDILVTCTAAERSLGGSVAGLGTGAMVGLQLNSEAPVSVGNGDFVFPSSLIDSDAYAVIVSTQPSNLSCVVTNDSGVINGSDVSDITVTCDPLQRTIGGSISGLGQGEEVQLTLNGSNARTLTSNGSFQFLGATLAEDDSYAVVLTVQSPGLDCDLTNASGIVAGANIDSIIVDCSPASLVIGGNASGIGAGEFVELDLNGAEVIVISGNGAFVFTTPVLSGSEYTVSLESVPDTLSCVVTAASGTVGTADVTNVSLACTPATFAVGGTVSGLGSEQIELTLGGNESIAVSADGAFGFATLVPVGGFYSVAITAQPQTLDCTIANATGTMGADVVDNVVVQCAPSALLSSLVTAVVAPLNPSFRPEVANYTLSVSLLAQELVLRPTAVDPNATILVAGVPVLSGELASPVLLDLGTNFIPVQVTAQSGAVQNYLLDVERGSDFAQVAYGKAPNSDVGDRYGFSAALSGDTLVVGSINDASNAAGINGDQGDNTFPISGSAFVFRRSGTGWAQEAYLKASNPDVGDQFGVSVAIDGDTIVVGANVEDGSSGGVNGNELTNDGFESGAAYVFRRSGTTWSQEAYLKAATPRTNVQFGGNVALQGDVLAISAHGHDSAGTGMGADETDTSASNSGAIYIFSRIGTTWSQEAFIKTSNAEVNDGFGSTMAMSGDTLVAGAGGEASGATGVNGDQFNNDQPQSGAVYVFRRSGATWSQEAYIKASNTGSGDSFAIPSIDGDTLVVGATGEDSAATGIDGDSLNNNLGNPGAAYVFTRSGTTWSQQAYLKASNTAEFDNFGNRTAVHGDFIAIAAFTEDSAATGIDGNDANNGAENSGALYLFRRSGTTWSQEAYIKASNANAGDGMGVEKGLVLTGETLIVGAVLEDSNATGFGGDQADNSSENSGAIYVFQ